MKEEEDPGISYSGVVPFKVLIQLWILQAFLRAKGYRPMMNCMKQICPSRGQQIKIWHSTTSFWQWLPTPQNWMVWWRAWHESLHAASANLSLSAWYPFTIMPNVKVCIQCWIHSQILLHRQMGVVSKAVNKNGSHLVLVLCQIPSRLWNETRSGTYHLICKSKATRGTGSQMLKTVRNTTLVAPWSLCLLSKKTSRANWRVTQLKPVWQFALFY